MKIEILKYRFAFLLLLFPALLWAQGGGQAAYQFLTLPASAKTAALGGTLVASNDEDVNLFYQNPALLTSAVDNQISTSYINYISDINIGYAGYAKEFKNLGTFGLGVHYLNYGDFTESKETGEIIGSFGAKDMAVQLSYSRQLAPRFYMGLSLKTIYSSLEKYTSWGLATDLGIHYQSSDTLFAAGISCRNIGTQIKNYYGDHQEPLPFEVAAGITQRLAHAPFRFYVTLQHLQDWDLAYAKEDPMEEQKKEPSFDQEFLRHMLIGVEFLPSRNLFVDVGYNFQRREELAVEEKTSTVGFSWGFGFRLSKFRFSYGSAQYHLAGATNHFTLSVNLSDL